MGTEDQKMKELKGYSGLFRVIQADSLTVPNQI
ncbi:MAG: hypothetical protein CM1200mP18_16990 [Gammaproteobacteria bacterium]|nr:MAG: hypothetical protein CM1200mP18_16990 [Gammaproteobacteria bacterium]